MVPKLIEAIKVQGLVLVVEKHQDFDETEKVNYSLPCPLENIDGILKKNGVLRFNSSVSM